MTVITTFTDSKFKLNGFPYAKVYQLKPSSFDNKVDLVNVNDISDKLFINVAIEKIEVDGNTFNNIDDLTNATSELFSKASTGDITEVTTYQEILDGDAGIYILTNNDGTHIKGIYIKQGNGTILPPIPNIIGTFTNPITTDLDLSVNTDIIIYEGNTTPNVIGTQSDVIFTEEITEQGIYELKIEYILDKILITPVLIIKPDGERIPMILVTNTVENPTGTFTFNGRNFSPRAYSNITYSGDFEIQIDVEDTSAHSVMVGLTTQGGNTNYKGTSGDGVSDGYLLYMGITSSSELKRDNANHSFVPPDNPFTLPHNVGDKLSLKRVNDVVKMFYNQTEIHNYGTHTGDMYIHIAGSGTDIKMFNLLKK